MFTLDRDELSNYHPISNISLISKIIEHCQISTNYFSSNNLLILISVPSLYCKHHFTETALSYIHDHLVGYPRSFPIPSLNTLGLFLFSYAADINPNL